MIGSRFPSKWLIIGLVSGIGIIWGVLRSLPDGNLHITTCDVGQGDAIFVSYRSFQMLVDGGPDRSVLACLSRYLPFWDRTIEMVVLTHPQADHLTGLVWILERYTVERVITNGLMVGTAGFREFRKAVLTEGADVYLPRAGDEIRVDPLRLTILWPKERLGSYLVWESDTHADVLGTATMKGEVNETSVVLQLTFGQFEALFTGDIGSATEEELVSQEVLHEIEVLKVGHHGSKYSSSEIFLRALQPQLAIVSVGARNRYGHPTQETLQRLHETGARVLRTDLAGDIAVETDGKGWWIIR